jgi:signal transduction histidine kinase
LGKGINAQSLEAVMDPFYTEKKKKVKFGLGLPMLKFAAESTEATSKFVQSLGLVQRLAHCSFFQVSTASL